MHTLEDCWRFLGERALELNSESVNHIPYWIAMAGLEEEEFMEFILEKTLNMLMMGATRETDLLTVMAVAMSNGWITGYIYAKREELLDE